ncbi:Domain of unknown function DUF2088 [Acididesulfobacillus acetoxydans]|uniref:Transcriptional regulator n=1 Tax=Acididesulfobacillus acetoxydans TaxID=1561005 RepID=A0A8S0VYJ4_9FIRM|nr:nickel-dependent lactate racemase [Acididesulfobacillus acetoxydans]CAA7603083.1 Domain of unknown function DUF2088 [Acididesulfobacillus acetoxydans]CEJ05679.1 Transcriptional regulator [Acididesulfobacillus acetoxydans]
MLIEVPYGYRKETAVLPDACPCEFIKLYEVGPPASASQQLDRCLQALIGATDLDKLKRSRTVAIAVSDITRPAPSRRILEALLPWLNLYGIRPDNVTVLVGGGLHRPAKREDLDYILGETFLSKIKNIVVHDADDQKMQTFLGYSPLGTPVYVNKFFARADFKIATGVIDAHQFMGFTGGVKGAVIGLGGRPTITANHARLFNPGAEVGHLEDNPARQDLEEIGRIIGVDMVVNVLLNAEKQVIKAVAGHPVQAHRAGVEFARGVLGAEIRPADIVIASAGGFPKDINIYQAQKALTIAAHAVTQGGTIILVAECREGSGEESFEKEMSLYESPQEVVTAFQTKRFTIGPHKAFLWSKALLKARRVILVSENVPADLAKRLMITAVPSLQEAVNLALQYYPGHPSLAVLPNASSLIPTAEVRT